MLLTESDVPVLFGGGRGMEQSPSRLDDATNVELESTTPGMFKLKAVFRKLAFGFRSLWRKQLGTPWAPSKEEEREADINTNTSAEVPRTPDTLAPRSSASALYSSARIDRMMQTRSTFGTQLEFEIDSSKDHWSEVPPPSERYSQDPEADFEQGILAGESHGSKEFLRDKGTYILKNRDDAELLNVLFQLWPSRFLAQADTRNQWKVGRLLGEGAQAEIFEAVPGPENIEILGSEGKYVLKVFRKEFRACDLQRLWPKQVATGYSSLYACPIRRGMLLDNGQFAFLMPRYWGDLRKFLDQRMQQRLDSTRPPCSNWEVIRSMSYIAKGMRDLHIINIVHRDLKASNVLVEMIERSESEMEEIGNKEVDTFYCRVADFESSKGVMGTGFWRAPEILVAAKHGIRITQDMFTKASDVYSYAMTCYELLTGCLPFEDFKNSEYDIVLGGERPTLPWCLEPWIQELLGRCWHVDPCERPTFQEICDTIANCTKGAEEDWQQHEGDGEHNLTFDEIYDILEEDQPSMSSNESEDSFSNALAFINDSKNIPRRWEPITEG